MTAIFYLIDFLIIKLIKYNKVSIYYSNSNKTLESTEIETLKSLL